MAQKTDAALQTQNDTIQTETTANANTAARIGQMYEDIIDSKINNDKIVDEDNMASNSATLVPTQQSVKAYVDAIGNPAWGEITGTLGDQTDLQTALGLKAALASPALTGVPTAPTASPGTNTTQIATTAYVDTALDFPNGLEVADTTGTAIAFVIPQTYGSVATPETGNITLNATGLVKGMVQLCLHNNASEPTFGSEFKRMTGSYITGVLNSIYMHAVSTTRIEYSILQEQS